MILKKKSHKLNSQEVFKALYRQSSISVAEDFNDKEINEYLMKDEESINGEEVSINQH